MARVYANLCEKGIKNLNEVPENIRAQVEVLVINDGYTINDDGTVTK